MNGLSSALRSAAALVLLATLVASCGDETARSDLDARLGGETTRVITGRNSFSFAAPTLTNEERRIFEIGDSFFTQNWVTAPASTDARDGLGPTFNAQACSSCHTLDGRGVPGDTGSGNLGLLLRLSVVDANGEPGPVPDYGDQLQDRSILGVPPEGELRISYAEIDGEYADGSAYTLLEPTYTIDAPAFGPLPDDVLISPRLAPQVVGMGLLEAIPEEAVRANEDPGDGDDDGISGRANTVWNPRTGRFEVGRFGWKANVPTVEAQTAGAFHGDIGITSELHPEQDCPDSQRLCAGAPDGGRPELTESRLASVTFYGRTLAVPAARDVDDREVRNGADQFAAMGCASCHVTTFTTGSTDVAALSGQTVHPYTDLLLHDMGPGLADGRPDFEASGTEWRTPPLWGIGLIDDVGGERRLLHDGRARSIEEAILWHGGEAESARERFRTAAANARDALVRFLESL